MIKVMDKESKIIGTATTVTTLQVLVESVLKHHKQVRLLGQLHGFLFSGNYNQPQLAMIFERLAKYNKSRLQADRVY